MTDTEQQPFLLDLQAAIKAAVAAEKARFAPPEDDAKPSAVDDLFSSDQIMKLLSANEDGDARVYIELLRDRFCYDHAAGRFYQWQGHYWAEDLVDEATAAVAGVVNIYGCEARRQAWLRHKAEKSHDTDKANFHKNNEDALFARIRQIQTANRKRNILKLAVAGLDSLGIDGFRWDNDPWVLPAVNGVIDLRTGELRPGNQMDYLKTVAPTPWRRLDEPCPTWERFISDILNEKQELVAFVQRLLGYSITGLSVEHIFPIFHGSQGRNGKGVLFGILHHVLGPLACPVQPELLLDQGRPRSSASASPDLMSLRGRRLVWASETGDGARLNSARVKALVGGDTLVARPLYGRHDVVFAPTHTIALVTNHKPRVAADDEALWRRIVLIPFEISFVDDPDPTKKNERKRDPHLLQRLMAESSGILAWLVRGCLAWQAEGLNPPTTVRVATDGYRQDQDIIGDFLKEECVTGMNCMVRAGQLYELYKAWCLRNEHRTLSGKRFGTAIKNRFDSTTNNGVVYLGIGLLQK